MKFSDVLMFQETIPLNHQLEHRSCSTGEEESHGDSPFDMTVTEWTVYFSEYLLYGLNYKS